MKLSHRVDRLTESATVGMSRRAQQLGNAGQDIISLSAGLPDFDTPACIREAAQQAMNSGQTRYTAVDGTAALKQAIIDDLARRKSLHYSPDQIIVTHGAKQALYNAVQALIGPGDEVIIPAPYWVSYPAMVTLAEGEPRIVECPSDQSYKLSADVLSRALTPATRMLILNSPGNPTGQVYSVTELQALAEVIRVHPNLMVLSDEIYDQVSWGPEAVCSLAEVAPDLQDRIIVVNGVSKSHAMTGWRIGYAAADCRLIHAMRRLQGQSTSNACSISQAAAVAALRMSPTELAPMNRAYQQRHQRAMRRLEQLPGMHAQPVDATFYLLIHVQEAMQATGCLTDVDLAERILDQAGVALVPGSAFGCPDHLRISVACSSEQLDVAFYRIANFLQQHSA